LVLWRVRQSQCPLSRAALRRRLYARERDGAAGVHRLPPPTDVDIAALLARVQRRVERLVVRRGRGLDAEAGSDPFAAQAPLFASAVTASLQGRVALGPRAGRPAPDPLALGPGTKCRQEAGTPPQICRPAFSQ
jgi:hypothetical protein